MSTPVHDTICTRPVASGSNLRSVYCFPPRGTVTDAGRTNDVVIHRRRCLLSSDVSRADHPPEYRTTQIDRSPARGKLSASCQRSRQIGMRAVRRRPYAGSIKRSRETCFRAHAHAQITILHPSLIVRSRSVLAFMHQLEKLKPDSSE
jgi:hypothetical protein